MKKLSLSVLALFLCLMNLVVPVQAQNQTESVITSLPNEKWWGGIVELGSRMPYEGNLKLFDLSVENLNNQSVPLLLSSAGRYIWSDKPFSFEVNNGVLKVSSRYEKLEPVAAGKTLREAYLAACATHFPPSGKIPEPLFFSMPQYNTWIELLYDQNQEDILKYAQNILDHDFPVGVFMVDDNWQNHYGNFDFKPGKFSDPKAMNDWLHEKGFKIMLWICPFVSPDSPEYRDLLAKKYLIGKKDSWEGAIISWWNGQSACYDLTNPEAVDYLINQLKETQRKYGVDGFKFDAGDVRHFTDPQLDFHDKNAISVDLTEKWGEIGLQFPYNEFRAGWKNGGQPLVQRLGDKNYSWDALRALIPDMISAGLLGQLYTCPDMIGGGQFGSFIGVDQTKMDQELIVRSCQVHAMMPMMQFSVAPWRILDAEHLAICRKYARLHEQMGDYILQVAENSSKTGEPMVRHMEYAFPHQGFIDCKDQFMLGDKYMVAPMVHTGTKRTVMIPRGRWKDETGKTFRGPRTVEIDVPLDRLPYFELIK